MFQKYEGMEKLYEEERDITIFCWNFFFLTVPKNFVGGINQCFRIIKAWKIFLQEKEISLLSVGNFFSHSAEKFREGNHSMFQKFSGMEYFSAEEGHINIFRWNFFFLTVPKSFVRGIIQCFRNFRAWKNFMQKEGISVLSVEISFFSQCRNISWEELINVSEILGHGLFFCTRRTYH